jgi:V/A-type H+-transporting ATPase subunit D
MAAVRVPQITLADEGYRPQYGPASASEPLDRAGARFASALVALAALASEESAVRHLRAALARTARRVNALERIVLPETAALIRAVTSAIEEDDRDDAIRRKIGSGGILGRATPANT